MNGKPLTPGPSGNALAITRVAAFDRLAEAMPAELPAPLYTVVDEADAELTAGWRRAGFAIRRREREFAVPTDPNVPGLEDVQPTSGVATVPAGQTDENSLRAVTVKRPRIGRVAVRAAEQRRGIGARPVNSNLELVR